MYPSPATHHPPPTPTHQPPTTTHSKLIARTDVQGAVTSVYAATSDDEAAARTGGVYFDSARPHAQAPLAGDRKVAERLWRASGQHLAAVGFPVPNKLPAVAR